MKKQLLAIVLLVSTLALGQRDTTAPAGGVPRVFPGAGAGAAAAVRTSPKPYKEVITDKAVTQKGMFTVHKVEDKYFFEISNDI